MIISTPVSLGELVDKISILHIKNIKIKDNEKLKLIREELDLLNKNIQLENTASCDDLTYLFNRKGFFLAAKQLIKSAKRDRASVCICYFDIDNLKPINDNYGHQVGDEIIKSFATHLKDTFREVDVIARFGGDEFVVMCQETTQLDISTIINRLSDFISEKKYQPELTFSYGYASINASAVDDEVIENLIKLADDEMYKNKDAKKTNNGDK